MREKVVCTVLLLSVTLGNLVNLNGIATSERVAVLIVLLVGTVSALPAGHLRTSLGRAATVCAFVACTAVSYLRFAAAPIYPIGSRVMIGTALMIVIVTAFALCALLAPMDARSIRRRFRCALLSPVAFVAINLGLYVVGFNLPGSKIEGHYGSSELLSLIGVHASRANLPLTPGVNGAGEMAALAFVICAVLAYRGPRALLRIAVPGAAVSLATIFVADSRGALIFGLLALVLVAFLPRWTKRIVVVIPALLPIAPALILFTLGELSGLSGALSRQQGDFVTATGRQEVWNTVLGFLSHPHLEDLIGYGAYGQVRSGVGFQYSYLFTGLQHPQFASTHNIAFQTVLDMGYLGLVVFLVFLMVSVNAARVLSQRTGTAESTALLAGLIALSLFGADEALPGLVAVSLLVSVVVLACAAIRTPASSRSTPSSANRQPPLHAVAPAPPMRPRARTLAS